MPRTLRVVAATLCLLGIVPTARSAPQFATRPVALSDYYALVEVANPAVSPDGSRVAFELRSVVEDENRRHSEIWIVDSGGRGEPRRLTSPAHDSRLPRWSPDGTLLAFRSRRSVEGGDVWFLDLDAGGEAFRIEGVDEMPLFSPDGHWIAFTRPTQPTGRAAVRTRTGRSRYELDDEDEELIRSRFHGRIVDWMGYRFDGRGYRPDPRDPLATPPRELYVVPSTGGRARQLTRLNVDVRDATWGPDSNRIYFAADEQQRDEHTYERDDLWRVDLTGELVRLTDDGFVNRTPIVTPDGTALVFRRVEGLDRIIADKRGRGAPIDLFRLELDSGALTNLTSAWDLRPSSHRVGPDGSVTLEANVGGQRHLFRVGAGGNVAQMTEGRRWLGGFDFSADQRTVAYTGSSVTQPSALFATDLRSGRETRLTRFNDVLASDVRLVTATPQTIASTDGTTIEGWLMLPPGAVDDPPPLILAIHGGPHSAYGERFSFQFQLWVSAGYAVLYTNPRGSTGYGEDFLWATWGGWGNLDYEDVMAAVGTVIERSPVDATRLGVTGYSYGGFLTNWVITHTDRFTAAISGAGISNWISDYGTADIPRTKESEFYGPPWEERGAELLWQQSPIRHAADVTTPTLFLHGEDDYRVPIEQAEQMYTALRKQQVPARFVRYPETSHGGWRPWDVVHRHFEELRWWERHLGDR